MVSVLAAVILVSQRDLIRKVEFSPPPDGPPFHFCKVFRLLLIQIENWLGPRPFELRVESATLLEPVQLPDAQADTESSSGEDKQSRHEPLRPKHLKQEHD